MQPFQVSHILILISLTIPLLEAQYYSRPGCIQYCGQVSILYPFGIGRNCSANEWFDVDCKSSKPYLSALNNVEVLSAGSSSLTVNMSLVGADCKNPVQDSNLVLSTSHGKHSFLISGSKNILVVVGCGSGAIMKNETIVAGCSTTCGNDTVSDLSNCIGNGCCQTTIPDDIQSFTFNLTGLERRDGDGTCSGSAFLVDKKYAETFSHQSIVQDQSFIPISLSWNPSLIGCNVTCGKVLIPFPFGIGKSCSYNEWFNVDCNYSTPYLSEFNNVELLGVDEERVTVTVNVSKTSDCKNLVKNNYNLFLRRNPFSFYGMDNLLVVEGCGSAAIVDRNGTIVSGCSTTCDNDTVTNFNNCFGIGCCQTTINDYALRQPRSLILNLTGLERQGGGNGSCSGSTFLVDRKSFIQRRFSQQFAPITLTWAYDNGYVGPDASSECISCEQDGGYCYPDRSSTSCHFYGTNSSSSKRSLILGVSISMGVLFLTLITYTLSKIIKKTRTKRRKQRCFKRNGGLLLKQQEATKIGLVDKTILFTSNELEKATDHFNENRILGQGGQGTVYKGMLADGRIVAIKKSKVVDEDQLEQFINEVVILSQVNHRNVVKLMGCCLETEVPLLVSEFISNGTLYGLLQNETDEISFSLNMRLQIATEVAGAISYLHSATSIPIYHRDIKTTNILLDEKYRAKVSDFGTSRFVSIDQTHLTTLVKGTFGYLDPEYFQSSQFTEKSDVYSFGVVLLELLTREKPISLTRFGENRSLATHFLLAMEEGRVMSIFDAMVIKEGSKAELLAIAKLALRCLSFSGKNRPTMKEVATELEGIRLAHVPFTVENNFGYMKHCEEVKLTYDESTSKRVSFDYNPSQ